MTAEQTADRIINLINSSPRSPRKDEIIAVLMDAGPVSTSADMVMAVAGAYIAVRHDGGLQFQGFHVSHPEPTEVNCRLAILDWMRARVVGQEGAR